MAPKRIVILRHGEKPGDPAAPDDPANPDLAPAGVARATMLATLIPAKFGTPDWLIAAASSDKSHRPVETLQPLADALGFGPDKFIQTYKNDDYAKLANELLNKPRYSGKLVVVCWHHGNIPGLGLALGATAAQLQTAPEISAREDGLHWNATVFDRFWILDFAVGQRGVTFQSVQQSP
jgi:broad specificity phosphatase PhoE